MSVEFFDLFEITVFAFIFNLIVQIFLPSKWIYTKTALNNHMLLQYKIYNLVWENPINHRFIKLGYFTRFGEMVLYLHWLLVIAFLIVVLVGASLSQ